MIFSSKQQTGTEKNNIQISKIMRVQLNQTLSYLQSADDTHMFVVITIGHERSQLIREWTGIAIVILMDEGM